MNRNTFFVLFLLISNLVSGQDLKLWYSQPAQNWSEALPIGNSRLGAMVYGGIEREELQLNEETFLGQVLHTIIITRMPYMFYRLYAN